LSLEVPVGHGEGTYCLDNADKAVGLQHQPPVTILAGLARAAEHNVGLGGLVYENGGGGGVSKEAGRVLSASKALRCTV
jgi:hypothetical protein